MRLLHALTLLISLSAVSHAADTLTFEEAEKAMLAANPQAVSAALSLDAAGARVTSAQAALRPSFSADASYFRQGAQGIRAYDNYSYGLSGSQPLYTPALPAAVHTFKAALWAAQASRDSIASALRYQLKTSFADILNARETIKLSEETLKRRAENLELIRIKYQAGRENKAAVMETEAVLKTAQWQHEKYKLDLRLLERKLNRLLGRAAQTPVPGLELPQPPEPPAEFSEVGPRLESHYALSSARAALDSAEASVETAQSAILPSANASAGYLWSGTDWPSSPHSWNLGATLSFPIFSSGRLSSGLDAAQKALSAAAANYRDARDAVYLNAEDAFLSWREARSYMDAAKGTLDASEARAWLVRKQYLAGQTSYFEWRNVEEQLISDQNQYLAAGLGLIVSHAAFVQAIGE